jgi:heme-degrading monooxygenase HmoA
VGAEVEGVSVVSVLRLRVRDGSEAGLAEAYERLAIFDLARESGGFRSGRLLRPRERGEPFLVVAEWDQAHDYERWLDSPVRASLADELEPLLEGDPEATVYEEAVRG